MGDTISGLFSTSEIQFLNAFIFIWNEEVDHFFEGVDFSLEFVLVAI